MAQDEDLNVLGEIMRGGSEKVVEAGAVLCGGHSINDKDVKYGLPSTVSYIRTGSIKIMADRQAMC